jgi:hypothetical protein
MKINRKIDDKQREVNYDKYISFNRRRQFKRADDGTVTRASTWGFSAQTHEIAQ